MPFRVIKPTATDGHASTLFEDKTALAEWVEGIDFSGLGGSMTVAVEDEIVNTQPKFWKEIDALLEAKGPDAEIEIRQIPRLVGG